MKILIYSEYFFPVIGGVQTFMDLLARGISELNPPGLSSGSVPIEVTVATNAQRGEMDDSKLSYRVVRRPKFRELVRLIREVDVVHVEGPCFLPISISWAMRKPYVVEHHVYQAICPEGLLFKQPSQTVCVGHFVKREYAECLRCCTSSMGTARGIRSLLLAFPRRWLCERASANVMVTNHVNARLQMPRSRTIYHGIDEIESQFVQDGACRAEATNFGYVGRLVAEKGLPLLVEAANHLAKNGRDFRLTFIGDGPERTRLEGLVNEYGLSKRVAFAGEMRGAELARVAGQMAAVIMPSIWEETAGLAAIEQMMRGRLVIAADIGGLGEIVDGVGLKFRAGDWRDLASAMQRVIDEPSLVVSLGSVARTRADLLFRREFMIKSQIDLFKEIIGQ
ncbi:MAG: glycosyltransferase family 4 protein [Candidatus Acidiferrales bacterium]